MAVRRFGSSDYAVQEEDTLLVAYDEGAVYGLELAFPESDDVAYRVDLVRTTREASGAELEQRLTLAEYPSQMEAEDHLMDASNALYENGRESIVEYLPSLTEQVPEYTAGFMVVSYPPDAVLTGESASVSIMALNRDGLQDALVGWNMPPHDASHLAMYLEDTQAEGGAAALLQAATEEAQAQGMRQPDEPLFAPSPHAPTFYLDQRAELDREAAIAADAEWGWHEARFAILPPAEERESYQAALLDVYRDALTGDVAGSYLSISEHETAAEAEQARDVLIEGAFEAYEDSSGWRRYTEAQVDDPVWQPMQPQHYELYEHISGGTPEPDMPPDEQLDPLLAEAMRLGAVITDIEKEKQGMSNTLKAEHQHWEVDLNEHVTHLPPHVTAEYRTPTDQDGITPVRLRPEGDDSMYGFEVSAPDEDGAVTLAATKTFESEILQKDVIETAVLKTYSPADYEESASYLNPRSDALSDARSLVYEWGRHDLDHGMGSALKLAQEDGFKGEQLFAEGPADTFTPVEDARSVEVIQTERDWERDAEIFGAHGYKVPLPEETVHAREVGRYGSEAHVPPGQFYAVTVREANLDVEAEPVYVVEGVKAWLDRKNGEAALEAVALGIEIDREDATTLANAVVDTPAVPNRLERMTELANDFAARNNPHIEQLGLTVREDGLFENGPPDPRQPPHIQIEEYPRDYTRTIGEEAYDLPLEDGQAYAFRARRVEELEDRLAAHGVDAVAVEAVKGWQANDEPRQEVVTLGIYYDRDEARQEVDTYVELAEREGIQASMTRAAMLADVQNYPNMIEEAEELGIHPNEDVRFGEMFSAGPDDPFLSEREINHIAGQYAEEHPPHHQLSLEVVPVQDKRGNALGHSVVALDATWDAEEPPGNIEDASITAYELAQFDTKKGADFYSMGLSEYMGKQNIDMQGADISEAVNFVKAVQETNGLTDNERWLTPTDVAQLARGGWTLQENPEDFNPITVENIGVPAPVQVITQDMDL